MQKKVIALAVAALASSAAFAQTNVTIYGVVDLGQAFVRSSKGTTAAGADVAGQGTVGRLDNNSSYVGFKGTEDLGNGLKAIFQLEVGYNADDANGSTSTGFAGGRDSFIGLAGNFGTFVAGNITPPTRAMGTKVELVPGAAGFGSMAAVTGQLGGVKTGADERSKNTLAYITPNFSGFTGTVAYVNGETKTTSTADQSSYNSRALQVAGQYENGPLFGAVAYHKAKAWSATIPAGLIGDNPELKGTEKGQDARVIRVAAAYTFPTATKLTAMYDSSKVELGESFDGSELSYIKRNAWSLGVAQAFGRNTVGLEYGQSGKIKTDAGSLDDSSSKIVTAVYTYELSKRTMLHARYSHLANDKNVNNNFYLNSVKDNGGTSGFGSDYSGFMAGIRHSF